MSRTEFYWQSGSDGRLRFMRCEDCGWRIHPPRPVCPKCRQCNLSPSPVSGNAVVSSFTINRYQWNPEMTPPYIVAEVEMEEQSGLRILTNIVDCPIDEVHIGMPVAVLFRRDGEDFVPIFRPVAHS